MVGVIAYHISTMGITITMDKAGRIVLPRVVRERLGLNGPAQLEVVDAPEGVMLRPVGPDVPISRSSSGWVVFHSDATETPTGSVDPSAAIDAERDRRIRGTSGE
jgi:AbrB family looped-hinge helix DNA binding protein